jgi:hypothetical protein
MSPLANALRVHHLLRARGVSEHTHEALTTAATREMLRATRVMLRTRTHTRARVHAHSTHVVWRTEAGFSLVAILKHVKIKLITVRTHAAAAGNKGIILFEFAARGRAQRGRSSRIDGGTAQR